MRKLILLLLAIILLTGIAAAETPFHETFINDGWFLIFVILAVCIWLMSQSFKTETAVIIGGLIGFSVLLIGLTDTIPAGQIIFLFMISVIGAAIYLRWKGGNQ